MEQFLFIFIHLGIPLLIALALIIHLSYSKIGLFSTTLFYVGALWFLILWGQWPIAAGIYFKYLALFVLIMAVMRLLISYRKRIRWFPKGIFNNVKNAVLFVISCLSLFMVYELYQGRNYPEQGITLEFPLRNGKFYIASGGSNEIINNHFGASAKSQQYAIDINKIGAWGRVSKFFDSSTNQSHYIYGEPVYCPCDGRVLEMVKDIDDNTGTNMSVERENGQGNFVSLDCNNTIVSLVHLKKNSIAVVLGQSVRSGELLGFVGNSGFSQEPHLHLQASTMDQDSILIGIPMIFKGRKPFRNDIIYN